MMFIKIYLGWLLWNSVPMGIILLMEIIPLMRIILLTYLRQTLSTLIPYPQQRFMITSLIFIRRSFIKC